VGKREVVIVVEGSPREIARILGLSRRQRQQLAQRPRRAPAIPSSPHSRVLVLRRR